MSTEVPVDEPASIDPAVESAVKENKPIPGTEQFWDKDRGQYKDEGTALAESYAELRKAYTKATQENKTEASPTDEAAESTEESEASDGTGTQDSDDTTAEDVVDAAGLDLDKLREAYSETGEIPAEDKEKIIEQLKPLGVGEEALDLYLQAEKAKADKATQDIYEIVGGQEAYQERIEWARENLSPDEIQAFDAVANSGDTGQIKLAVRGLEAQYVAANGSAPSTHLAGRRAASSSVKPFESQEEATAAVRNPEYQNNPAYRREVSQRLAASVNLRNR